MFQPREALADRRASVRMFGPQGPNAPRSSLALCAPLASIISLAETYKHGRNATRPTRRMLLGSCECHTFEVLSTCSQKLLEIC